jgi:hypothetical protein
MTKPAHIVYIFLILFISCSENKNNSIIGKWVSYNDLGYCESLITHNTFETFSEIMGNMNKWNYKINNNTIKLMRNYKAQIIILNDSVFILKEENIERKFYRINDSTQTFNVDLMTSRIKGGNQNFEEFIKRFNKRKKRYKLENGIITKKQIEKSKYGTIIVEEEINK